MASARSPAERAELSTFIRALYEIGEYVRWTEFAADAGVHPVSLSNWQNGEVVPDGYNVLKLIRAVAERAGSSSATLAAAVASADRDARLDIRLRELEGAVDGLRHDRDLLIAGVVARLARLEEAAERKGRRPGPRSSEEGSG